MANSMTFMVNFKYDYFDKPSLALKKWLTSNKFHAVEGILSISASTDFQQIWIVMEASSESQLLNIIENLEYLAEYEYHYYSLELTSSIFNFSRHKINPEK